MLDANTAVLIVRHAFAGNFYMLWRMALVCKLFLKAARITKNDRAYMRCMLHKFTFHICPSTVLVWKYDDMRRTVDRERFMMCSVLPNHTLHGTSTKTDNIKYSYWTGVLEHVKGPRGHTEYSGTSYSVNLRQARTVTRTVDGRTHISGNPLYNNANPKDNTYIYKCWDGKGTDAKFSYTKRMIVGHSKETAKFNRKHYLPLESRQYTYLPGSKKYYLKKLRVYSYTFSGDGETVISYDGCVETKFYINGRTVKKFTLSDDISDENIYYENGKVVSRVINKDAGSNSDRTVIERTIIRYDRKEREVYSGKSYLLY